MSITLTSGGNAPTVAAAVKRPASIERACRARSMLSTTQQRCMLIESITAREPVADDFSFVIKKG